MAKCSSCGSLEIYVTAALQVESSIGGTLALPDASSVCLSCGLIVEHVDDARVSERDKARLRGMRAVGLKGTAGSLGLPDWGDPMLAHTGPSVARRLMSGFRALPREDVIGRIMAANGGNQDRLHMQCPSGVPPMQITRDVVTHIVRDGEPHHVLYAPLIRDVLEDPMEVWSRDVDDKPNQIHFLKKFTEGAKEITVMVVGDEYKGFLRTGYRLSGPKQAQKKRSGVLLYRKWPGE